MAVENNPIFIGRTGSFSCLHSIQCHCHCLCQCLYHRSMTTKCVLHCVLLTLFACCSYACSCHCSEFGKTFFAILEFQRLRIFFARLNIDKNGHSLISTMQTDEKIAPIGILMRCSSIQALFYWLQMNSSSNAI